MCNARYTAVHYGGNLRCGLADEDHLPEWARWPNNPNGPTNEFHLYNIHESILGVHELGSEPRCDHSFCREYVVPIPSNGFVKLVLTYEQLVKVLERNPDRQALLDEWLFDAWKQHLVMVGTTVDPRGGKVVILPSPRVMKDRIIAEFTADRN